MVNKNIWFCLRFCISFWLNKISPKFLCRIIRSCLNCLTRFVARPRTHHYSSAHASPFVCDTFASGRLWHSHNSRFIGAQRTNDDDGLYARFTTPSARRWKSGWCLRLKLEFNIGRITVQRKGNDSRNNAKMLQFKINPIELIEPK